MPRRSECALLGPDAPEDEIDWPVPDPLRDLPLYCRDEYLCRVWPERLPLWEEAYPELDILLQTRRAHDWELHRPRRRKVDRPRFLSNWFRRAAERWPEHDQEDYESEEAEIRAMVDRMLEHKGHGE